MDYRRLWLVVLTIGMSLFIVNSYGQDIKIVNSTKSKSIKKTDIVEIAIGKQNCEDCCDYKVIKGKLLSVVEDTILMNVSTMEVHTKLNDISKQMILEWGDEKRLKSALQTDILYLKKYRSKKERKNREALSTTGGILMFGGVITALNTLFVVKKGRRNNLLALSGIEFGAGLIIGLSLIKKKYKFKNVDDPWRFSD